MFEYLFPIFAFGVVVTGIVCKGLLAAADMAKAEVEAHARAPLTPLASQVESRAANRVVINSGTAAA